MRNLLLLIIFLTFLFAQTNAQQKKITQIITELETSPNPVGYTREILKKKYVIDTIIISNTVHFIGIADSLGYYGKLRKVYGPYEKKYLVQVLAKSPNTFNRVSQIFIDTTVFSFRIADSLANNIITRIKSGEVSFEDMAQTYSMGGEGKTKGELGWVAQGAMIPEVEKQVIRSKKNEILKVWSRSGVHIIKKTAEPKQDNGFALLMRVFL